MPLVKIQQKALYGNWLVWLCEIGINPTGAD